MGESVERGTSAVGAVVEWYFREVYGTVEGPGVVPFYCDQAAVGAFAVPRSELASAAPAALFRLFVALSMYQALRDTVIRRRQRTRASAEVEQVADLGVLEAEVAANPCAALRSGPSFRSGCDVSKAGGEVDCSRRTGARCHVKGATRTFNRMGDLGKLPTSAWFEVWQPGVEAALVEVCRAEPRPEARATLLVDRFSAVHRVGRKLATMFVSALSTPALAPGLTPWFPEIDGNALVVVDTHVARAADLLRPPGSPRTYEARARWVRDHAAGLDLRQFRGGLPRTSPRLVQQALYAFGSRSNRTSRQDSCATSAAPCASCVPVLCPFTRA